MLWSHGTNDRERTEPSQSKELAQQSTTRVRDRRQNFDADRTEPSQTNDLSSQPQGSEIAAKTHPTAHSSHADAAEICKNPTHVSMMSTGAAALSVKPEAKCVMFEGVSRETYNPKTHQNAQSTAESQGQDRRKAGNEWNELLNRRPPEEDRGRNTTFGRESV
ncbi:hypothetical protein PGT21_000201 [Puccinia graminis f. sp. tritici]|uniref:Uncharacterized protein n=1 Tax=Puccinia graminis f. sp. tritici TaxID=56615 RepID=A0A5B0M8L6_PUCGR|nr:hypothetical protein PGT21_000201 [Puccinia graminis f. sp. tritici]